MTKVVSYEVLAENFLEDRNGKLVNIFGSEDKEQLIVKIDTFDLVVIKNEMVIERASALVPPEFVYYTIIGYEDSDGLLHRNKIRETIMINDELECEVVKKIYYRVGRVQRNKKFLAERRDSLGMNE